MPSKNIAIAGLGEIGKTVARKLTQGLPGLALAVIATRDQAKAQAWLDREGISCPLVSLDEIPAHADLVVECAPAAILDQICRPMLRAGKQVMVLSASALLPRPDLVDLANVIATYRSIDTPNAEVMVAKLEPLAAPDRPFRLSVLELQALVAGRKGDAKRARELWSEIARDPLVPQGLAQRAASMVNFFGPGEAK